MSIIIDKINDVIKYFAPKKITIPAKHVIREPWITPGILHSSKNLDKLYKKQLDKENVSREHVKYITYRNNFTRIKRKQMEIYYGNLFISTIQIKH